MNNQIVRCIHLSRFVWDATKSNLAKLRKKTGYTFANCKKALDLNDNDLVKAEKWLADQAQALGWSKAAKLEGRATVQGLVGIALENNSAAVVEVNCETDFVARNKTFKNIVDLVANTCLFHVKQNFTPAHSAVSKLMLDSAQMGILKATDSKSLADHVALVIGSVGENITLKRAACVSVPTDFRLTAYSHPSNPDENAPLLGKYGTLLVYSSFTDDVTVNQTAKQLCQHIVGMNPVKIGEVGVDEPKENSDDETCMIHQEFLLDPEVTVGQVASDIGIKMVEFIRFECGESSVDEGASEKATQQAAGA